MNDRPKLGIALGSGSARGWAHIGVLLALTEQGIAPDFVAGCSMGAMVGAAFAAGRIGQLETYALSLDWKRVVGLLDLGLRGGLIKGDRLLNMFQGQFVECQFSELAIPFAVVATDLQRERALAARGWFPTPFALPAQCRDYSDPCCTGSLSGRRQRREPHPRFLPGDGRGGQIAVDPGTHMGALSARRA